MFLRGDLMEFKELTVDELSQGYVWDESAGAYICIFCGERFEEGLIHSSHGRMLTAERAVKEHITDAHGGVFDGLTSLDKQIHGLSDSQRDILEGMYMEKDNKTLAKELGISVATVRTHKFNIQRMKREAKILLALLEQIENPDVVNERKRLDPKSDGGQEPFAYQDNEFEINRLHPFFTQFNLK